MASDDDSKGSGLDFIDPQRLFTTALGITVGLSWNNAVREAVDEYIDVETAGGAVWAAVLITLLAVAVYHLANVFYRITHSAFSSPQEEFGGRARRPKMRGARGGGR